MKWLPLLLACFGLAEAQQYYTGQAARLVIGQRVFTGEEPGTSDTILGSTGGLAVFGDTLLVADSSRLGGSPVNNRVLIYRNLSGFVLQPTVEFPQGTRCPACVGQATNVIGQPDMSTVDLRSVSQNSLRSAVGVAYNGRIVAVADTDNNRILIFKSLPSVNNANADLVVGQPDFKGVAPATTATGLRGPEGVWLDSANGLWVADTGNHRVLYYGEITQNNQAAKFALGQPNTGTNQQAGKQPNYLFRADTLLNPTSVTSDGSKLFVSDLGSNRVLIWNTIPTQNGQAADVVVGQPDMTSGTYNNTSKLCASNGTDKDGNATYPSLCAASLSFPRYALSDGKRLYVADGGNDRVLIWNQIPQANALPADVALGHQGLEVNQTSDSAEPARVSSTDSFRTPVSLAWDGTNLYVSDDFNRRVLVYTPGDFPLPITAVRNAASPEVYAHGSVAFSGTLTEKDVLSVKIGSSTVLKSDGTVADPIEYKVTVAKDDSFSNIINQFVSLINASDQWVFAIPNVSFNTLVLNARQGGEPGNDVTLATAVSPDTSKTTLTASGANLSGGQNAARIAPYALVSILGDNLADQTVPAVALDKPLPNELGGVQFYVDGIKCPIIGVSPTRVVAQLPVEVRDGQSSSGILRVVRSDGRVTVSNAVAIPVIAQNPGVFNQPSLEPSPGFAFHSSSNATATVSIDGSAKSGDQATIVIRDREYTYNVQAGDTNATVRDALIQLINSSDPEVEAYRGGSWQRVRIRARIPGPAGNGIPVSGKTPTGANVIVTAYNSATCCANEAGAPVDDNNPAVPGETIVVLATGLGVVGPDNALQSMVNGQPYQGPVINEVSEFVSALAGGKTANVLFAGLRQGAVGVYEVHLELNPDMPTNPKTEVTIAQSFEVSNLFTIPVVNPKPQ